MIGTSRVKRLPQSGSSPLMKMSSKFTGNSALMSRDLHLREIREAQERAWWLLCIDHQPSIAGDDKLDSLSGSTRSGARRGTRGAPARSVQEAGPDARPGVTGVVPDAGPRGRRPREGRAVLDPDAVDRGVGDVPEARAAELRCPRSIQRPTLPPPGSPRRSCGSPRKLALREADAPDHRALPNTVRVTPPVFTFSKT